MPVYDLSKQDDRLKLLQELKNPKAAAWLIERKCGKAAVDELRELWRAQSILK